MSRDATSRAVAITEAAQRSASHFNTNGDRQAMLGPVLDRLDAQDSRIRTLSFVSQGLATKNANLEATMKQVTNMLIKLLQELRQSAVPPPTVQSGSPALSLIPTLPR